MNWKQLKVIFVAIIVVIPFNLQLNENLPEKIREDFFYVLREFWQFSSLSICIYVYSRIFYKLTLMAH